ncbi:MAG: hypothetical protein JW763_10075 [candidate division Zixibacteria bacterium]|nr:hypothetical protein [candidate division Zixibacteria bacterium]
MKNVCLSALAIIGFLLWMPVIAIADSGRLSDETIPGSYEITSPNGIIRFPFTIHGGDIRFACQVNGHEVYLLLDDGFMWDQLLFWGSSEVDSLGLQYDGEIAIGNDTNAADRIASRTASGITLDLPGVTFLEQTAVVTPYSSGNAAMWAGSVGQVSATFFKHFVVAIDFDDMTITLSEPEQFEYTAHGVAIPWEPMGFGPWKIPARIGLADGREVSLDFMMDLGYNAQLQLATGGENKITAPKDATPASLGMNIQRVETRGHVGYLAYVTIGGYMINRVLADFVLEEQQDHTFHEAMVGLGLLSRFNLVFDYRRHRLFIEPNKTFADPFE